MKQSNNWLQCIYSPNWLTAEVIDSYMQLLQKNNPNIIIFNTIFKNFMKNPKFKDLDQSYKERNIIEAKQVFIPIMEENYCYLIIKEEENLMSIDPYNYQNLETSLDNHRSSLQYMIKLKESYFDPLYENLDEKCPKFNFLVSQTPEIPTLIHDHDCGVYVAMYIKYKIEDKLLKFDTSNIINYRETMKKELLCNEVISVSQIKASLKRQMDQKQNEYPEKIAKQSRKCPDIYRTIKNPDMTTCWLNSCLQLLLAAIDHRKANKENGSLMWQLLLTLFKEGKSYSLDPIPIRDLIVNIEQERIRNNNINPQNRLFDLGINDASGLINKASIGQQDYKDFFICLDENREHWPDLHSIFKLDTIPYTICSNCSNVSISNPFNEEKSILMLEYPAHNEEMSTFIQ